MIATVVTIIATVITIVAAVKVETKRKAIEKKYRKMALVDVRIDLEEVARLGNDLRTTLGTGGRGQQVPSLTQPIHEALSSATRRLPKSGQVDDLSNLVRTAAPHLKGIENANTKQARLDSLDKFMEIINDAVATCRGEFENADSKEI